MSIGPSAIASFHCLAHEAQTAFVPSTSLSNLVALTADLLRVRLTVSTEDGGETGSQL